MFYAGSGGRVRGVDLVFNVVPLGVFLVVLVFEGIVSVVLTARRDVGKGVVFVVVVVLVARVVVDSDSVPESDGDVSVAFIMGRRRNRNA
jgi:hypothetical protein